MNVQEKVAEIIEEIYGSYTDKIIDTQNLLDQEHRDPSNIIDLIKKNDLMPDSEKTIRAVGSKGKGITLNILKAFFREFKSKEKIATFSSPYKLHHLDQIQIDGERIPDEDFVRIYKSFFKELDDIKNDLDINEYLSPFGIMLLIGLTWFKEKNVDFYLLETGRGVKYDEVGNIPSKYGIFVSLSEEHLNHIGPTLLDVFLNKIDILNNVEKLLVPEDLHKYFLDHKEYISDELFKKIIWVSVNDDLEKMPIWYKKDYSLSKKMFSLLYPYRVFFKRIKNVETSNFGRFNMGNKKIFFDSGSSIDSMDKSFFLHLLERYPNMVIISGLDDRRDVWGVVNFVYDLKVPLYHVILKNRYLSYDTIRANFGTEILGEYGEADLENFRELIDSFSTGPITLYFIGSNKFIRFVKKLKIEK